MLFFCGMLAAAAETEYRCDFEPAEAAKWDLHAEGAGRVAFVEGTLWLDLRSPQIGKAAWAQLQPALLLPAVIEWEQQLAADSPHCYRTGLRLRNEKGWGLESVFLASHSGTKSSSVRIVRKKKLIPAAIIICVWSWRGQDRHV